jgi:hypothetical protein
VLRTLLACRKNGIQNHFSGALSFPKIVYIAVNRNARIFSKYERLLDKSNKIPLTKEQPP